MLAKLIQFAAVLSMLIFAVIAFYRNETLIAIFFLLFAILDTQWMQITKDK